MSKKEQYCDYCAESLGVFAHSRRLDGPPTCGKRECDSWASEQQAMEYEERRERAEDDEYGRY